ncbi:MAG: hypothetical protein P4L51_05800 [Puia sp.]|nr:hypothetical protein [Puia sp.]
MKKGKVILSAAAMIVSLLGSLAFKAHKYQYNILYTKVTRACHTVFCWTAAGGPGNGCTLIVPANRSVYTRASCSLESRYVGPITTTM